MSNGRTGTAGSSDPEEPADDSTVPADGPLVAADDDRTVAADGLDAVVGRLSDEADDDRTVAAYGVGEGLGVSPDKLDDELPSVDAELEAVLDRFGDEPADDRTIAVAEGVRRRVESGDAQMATDARQESVEDRTDPDEAAVWSPSAPVALPPSGGSAAGGWPDEGESANLDGATGGEPGGAADSVASSLPSPPPPPPPPAATAASVEAMPPAPGFDPDSVEQRWRPPARTRRVIEPEPSVPWPVWVIPIVSILAVASIIALLVVS